MPAGYSKTVRHTSGKLKALMSNEDKLEDQLHALVCVGKLPIEPTQHKITADWIATSEKNASVSRDRSFSQCPLTSISGAPRTHRRPTLDPHVNCDIAHWTGDFIRRRYRAAPSSVSIAELGKLDPRTGWFGPRSLDA